MNIKTIKIDMGIRSVPSETARAALWWFKEELQKLIIDAMKIDASETTHRVMAEIMTLQAAGVIFSPVVGQLPNTDTKDFEEMTQRVAQKARAAIKQTMSN